MKRPWILLVSEIFCIFYYILSVAATTLAAGAERYQSTIGSQSPTINAGRDATVIYGSESENKIIDKSNANKKQIIVTILETKKYSRGDLTNLTLKLGINSFNLSLDDTLLEDYYVIKIRLETKRLPIEHPFTLKIFTGARFSKVLDIKQNVHSPKYKILGMKHSIPQGYWTKPKSVKIKVSWETNSNNENMTYYIYRSMFRDSGYVRLNSEPVPFKHLDVFEESRPELFPFYYKVSVASGDGGESKLSEAVEAPNLAPLQSFKKKALFRETTAEANNKLSDNTLSDTELGFAKGLVDITYPNGADAGSDSDIFILCKMLPGTILAPAVSLEAPSTITYKLRNKVKPLNISSVRYITDDKQLALTPITVRFYMSSDAIYLKWDKPENDNFAGVRIFRVPEEYSEFPIGLLKRHEIYDGPGLKTPIELPIPSKKESSEPLPSKPALRFLHPPKRTKPLQINFPVSQSERNIDTIGKPTAVEITGLVFYPPPLMLDKNYFADFPPEKNKTYIYIVYGYNYDGKDSYPVEVKAGPLVDEIKIKTNNGGVPGTSMISFVKGKTEISLNLPN